MLSVLRPLAWVNTRILRVGRQIAWIALACQFAFAMIVGTYSGTAPAAMSECLPGQVRVTGTSLGYNLCMAGS